MSARFLTLADVADVLNVSGSQAYALVLNPGQILTVGPATLPKATVGLDYTQTITGTGGTGPYTCSISSGSLPPGLTLDAATCRITGKPTAGTELAVKTVNTLTVNGSAITLVVSTEVAGNASASNVTRTLTLEADGTLLREAHMRHHIDAALKEHKADPSARIVVVTGAFHASIDSLGQIVLERKR